MGTYTDMKTCPNCSGLLEREDENGMLVCPYCGYKVKVVLNGNENITVEASDNTSFYIYCIRPTKETIKAIKLVRELTGVGLKEAKDLVEGLPGIMFSNLSREKAEAIKKTLDDELKDIVVEIK